MKIQTPKGKTTNYEVYGDTRNPPVLLIHGLGAELSSWRNQIEEFPELGYCVIAPDMYGHGESSPLDHDDPAEWNDQIEDLLQTLHIERVILCGVSMGGVIAQNFAVSHADMIIALVISDSFGELRTFSERLLGASQILGFSLFKKLGRKTFAKGMAAAYKQDFASAARDYMYEQSLKADFDQLLLARKTINRVDVLPQLGRLSVPCLVTVGNCFGRMFVDVNRKIADAVPGSRFVELDKAMDPSPLVNPAAFNHEMLRFLGEVCNAGTRKQGL